MFRWKPKARVESNGWIDMERWQRSLRDAIRDPEIPARKFGIPVEEIRRVAEIFPFQVTRHYFSLIREKGDPIYRQCIPDPAELEACSDLTDDPLGEECLSPAPNVVRRYPDHCLLLVSDSCASYCRFCTRKRKFRKNCPGIDAAMERIRQGIDYVRREEAIRDVLISGGDPLLLEDDVLEAVLSELHAIEHVMFLRIGTRVPCVLPERITTKLARMLRKFHPLYLNVHFNHPDELNPQSAAALARLADSGIPLGSQTVLLRGVNDSPETIRDLMRKLLAARVRPYYLFQSDLIYGTTHFRTPLKTGLNIVKALRGRVSGMAIPHFAVDLPGGGGKIPLVPDYVRRIEGRSVVFENFQGREYVYPDLEKPPFPAR